MNKTEIDLAVIPYRKRAFARRYGFIVRDLMLLTELSAMSEIRRIDWFERPDLLPEIVGNLFGPRPTVPKLVTHDKFDPSLIGPLLQRRKWAPKSLRLQRGDLIRWSNRSADGIKVLLDFHPTFIPPIEELRHVFYWYDLIDNFTKHNLYDYKERNLVFDKYKFVKQNANLVTSVTGAASELIGNSIVFPNRLSRRTHAQHPSGGAIEFDLGFMGFITDKFDIEFVRRCSRLGLSMLICGDVYQPVVAKELGRIPYVKLSGKFNAAEASSLINRFGVGTIPYLRAKSHDESPIKLLQYLAGGRAILTSQSFQLPSDKLVPFVLNYTEATDDQLMTFVRSSLSSQSREEISQRALETSSMFWDEPLRHLIQEVILDPISRIAR